MGNLKSKPKNQKKDENPLNGEDACADGNTGHPTQEGPPELEKRNKDNTQTPDANGLASAGSSCGRVESNVNNTTPPASQQLLVSQTSSPSQPSGSSLHCPSRECKRKTIKFYEIDGDVRIKTCNYLDLNLVLGNDYRTLGGKLGFDTRDVDVFANKGNPTAGIITAWEKDSGNTLLKLIDVLKGMGRDDIAVQLLNPELERLSNDCNCESCGGIR